MSVINVYVTARKNESGESLIKRFSRKVKKEGIIEECKNRKYYEKPSVKKRRDKLKRKRVLKKLFMEQNGEEDARKR
ncbi:MAG TPA: 30S ribosomal protein S21 [Balneola sp.]|nr:30S ribosomal protein S21 [Balneola sp.]|tara:strand:+ start:123 stop:353 length:231 start_codon:yes stop_codon:yes gene_type:complete